MRLMETLTTNQIVNMLDGQPVGLFPSMIYVNDKFYKYSASLCSTYYMIRSGEKTISPSYEKLISFVKTNVNVRDSATDILGKLIRNKFIDKWNRIYDVLVSTEYNALDTHTFNSKISAIIKEVNSVDETNTFTANGNDSKTYGSVITGTGKFGSKENRVSDSKNENDYYGFNSSSAVNNTRNNTDSEETITRDADKNTTDTKETKTGTDVDNFVKNETDKKVSKDNTDTNTDRTIIENGRDANAPDLINSEIEMRKQNIFFDIVLADIDSMATLSIYI